MGGHSVYIRPQDGKNMPSAACHRGELRGKYYSKLLYQYIRIYGACSSTAVTRYWNAWGWRWRAAMKVRIASEALVLRSSSCPPMLCGGWASSLSAGSGRMGRGSPWRRRCLLFNGGSRLKEKREGIAGCETRGWEKGGAAALSSSSSRQRLRRRRGGRGEGRMMMMVRTCASPSRSSVGPLHTDRPPRGGEVVEGGAGGRRWRRWRSWRRCSGVSLPFSSRSPLPPSPISMASGSAARFRWSPEKCPSSRISSGP